ncbi:T9SS type A sorting domain-containing protein [bacterium]|nr:T9SS type A sorting domain-containing protein [bacterium]
MQTMQWSHQKLRVLAWTMFFCLLCCRSLANTFSSMVRIDFDGTFPAEISYTLAEAATSVTITIKLDGTTVKTINFADGEDGTFGGENTVSWDGTVDGGGATGDGVYTVEIHARDDFGHTTWELISLDIGPDNWFWSSAAVVANRRQTSPFFGMIYVNERTGGQSGNPGAIDTPKGLYLFDPVGLYFGFSQQAAYAEGNSVVNWRIAPGENSPLGLTLGPDDRVYLSVLGHGNDGIGGIVVGDGMFSSASVQEILPLQDLSNHGPISRVAVVGSGPDRLLYTCEQLEGEVAFDPDERSQTTMNVLRRYHVGDTEGVFTGQPEDLLADVLQDPFDVDFDSQGFMYVVQNEHMETAVQDDVWGLSKWDVSVEPPIELWHVGPDSIPPSSFEAVGVLPRGFLGAINHPSAPGTNFCGLAIDEPRGRIYAARRDFGGGPLYQILQFDLETGEFQDGLDTSVSVEIDPATGDTVVIELEGGRGSNQRDVAVDAAGNVISVNSSTEALRIFSPPDGPNEFLTHSPWAIQVGSEPHVIPTPIDFTTSVESPHNSSVPSRYSLAQNYPNPFNPETTIIYELPRTTAINIAIYNVLGQRVVTLVEGVQRAGQHSVFWNGTDANGVSVSGGVYFYQLKTEDFTKSLKMILLK